MNLIVDIGNSRTKFVWFFEDELVGKCFSDSTNPQLPKIVSQQKFYHILVSASGKILTEIKKALIQRSQHFILMDSETPIPLQLHHETPKSLGLDRKAACVGASVLYPGKDCLVFDAGTALTIDLLSHEHGMMGGNISPGLNLRFQSLHNFTEHLPLLKPAENNSPLGNKTTDSIINGVQMGILFEVKAYIERYSLEYPGILPVFTGGDVDFFVKNLKNSIFAQPDLVVIGLNRILKYYAEIN
ncbi:MAG: type III pantothenate kinase [Bacteroidales bacterium]|nr:type III pantothenate kinase [Bacteroidales bacterium]